MTSRDLEALLTDLRSGQHPGAARVTVLSDLDRGDLAHLRGTWPGVPPAIREEILTWAADLAEQNLDLDFRGLCRIGLEDSEPSVRRRAIEALWESDDRATAASLTTLLRTDPDDSVRGAAAQALGRFVLQRELDSMRPGGDDAIVEALRETANDVREPIDVRANAVESLGYRSLPWVDTVINDAYYNDDPRLRIAAIRAMGFSAQEKWVEYLEEDARSDDPEFRFEAAVALGTIGSEAAVDTLAELLHDEDAEVQEVAIASLGEISGEEAIRYLQEFAEEAPEELQDAVREAIDNALFISQEGDGGTLLRL
ncbi:MAG: HEAT repeat domain-containing protein [Hyphomicrobiales bacterium]